jgi:hypothetical protein
MSRFTKKILLPVTPQMYSELLYRSKANGSSVNAEIRLAVAKMVPPQSPDAPDPKETGDTLEAELAAMGITFDGEE